MNIIHHNFKLTRKYRNDKLVAAVDCTFESFFSKPLRVSIAFKERRREITIYNDWIHWHLNNHAVKCPPTLKNASHKKIPLLSKHSCVVEMNAVFLTSKSTRGQRFAK